MARRGGFLPNTGLYNGSCRSTGLRVKQLLQKLCDFRSLAATPGVYASNGGVSREREGDLNPTSSPDILI